MCVEMVRAHKLSRRSPLPSRFQCEKKRRGAARDFFVVRFPTCFVLAAQKCLQLAAEQVDTVSCVPDKKKRAHALHRCLCARFGFKFATLRLPLRRTGEDF